MAPNLTAKPTVYLITTCPRCRRVKEYLDRLGIEYEAVPVDLLPREERQAIVEKYRQYHPVVSFPIIEAGDILLIGTNPEEISRVFGFGG